jgi:antitoxin (DNA-binding transcriptional repressor) of toxin-antitoxin stability system
LALQRFAGPFESDNLIRVIKSISATEAARSFSDLLARVRYRGEEFIIEKGGEPMCRVSPARVAERSTASSIAELLLRLPKPDSRYWDAVESAARKQPKAPKSRWGR